MYQDDEGRWRLEGDPDKGHLYDFHPYVDGDDLVVDSARCTWFGGDTDPLDNGETASGERTKGHPDCLGCALPLQGHRPTASSPLPDLPWGTLVRVFNPRTKRQVTVRLIDLGPSPPPRAHAGIDLTVAAFTALGVSLRTGEQTVRYRILGGATHLPESVREAMASDASA